MVSSKCILDNLFSTKTCSLELNEKSNEFILNMPHDTITLNLCSLIVFKRKLEGIDIVEILNDAHTPDIEIISMLNCNRMILLDVKQILELKELISGAFTMLELNSIIHREILRNDVFGI